VARLYLKKTLGGGFIPADEPSLEVARKYKTNEVYRADIVKPRSYKNHCLIFSLLSLTYENQDRYTNFDTFRKAVAFAAGHIVEYPSLDGEVIREADSLSYDRLDQPDFERISGAMMEVCAHILGDLDLHELQAEVARYASDRYGVAA